MYCVVRSQSTRRCWTRSKANWEEDDDKDDDDTRRAGPPRAASNKTAIFSLADKEGVMVKSEVLLFLLLLDGLDEVSLEL